MDNRNGESIKHVRNIGRCVQKGVAMYLANYRKMALKAWPFALIHAVVFAMLLTIFVDVYLPLNNSRQLGIAVDEMALFGIVVLMLAMFVAGGVLEICVYFALLRIFSPGSVFTTFARGLRLCLRHLGTAAGTACLSLLIVLPALCIFMLPAIVLVFANLNIQIGLLNGDAVEGTSSIQWLTFIVYLISGIVKLLITSLPLFIFYYTCGSMIAKDEAKTKFDRER